MPRKKKTNEEASKTAETSPRFEEDKTVTPNTPNAAFSEKPKRIIQITETMVRKDF